MAREFEIDLRKLAAMQLPFEAVLKALSVRHRANLLLTCSDFENALPETERWAAARRFIYQFAKRQGVDLSGRHFGKAGGTASVALRRLALHVLIRDHSQLMVGNRWRLQTERFGTFRKDIARSIILDTLRSGVYAGFCFDSWMDIPSLLHYAAAKDKQVLEAIIQGANFDKAARRLDHRAMSALACACMEAPENALLLLKVSGARVFPCTCQATAHTIRGLEPTDFPLDLTVEDASTIVEPGADLKHGGSRLAPGQRTSLKNACRRSSKHILRFTSRASEDTPGTRRRERACCSSSSLNNLAPYLAAASPASLPSTSPPSLPPSSRCAAPTQTPTSSQLKEEGQATLNTPICPTVCGSHPYSAASILQRVVLTLFVSRPGIWTAEPSYLCC